METITKRDIVDALMTRLAKKGPISKQTIADVVDGWVDEVVDILASGKRIELRGFGVFTPKERKARKARNPKTGAAVDVPARTTVGFSPGKDFKIKLGVRPATPVVAVAGAK